MAESVPDATGFSESQDDLGAGAAADVTDTGMRSTETASDHAHEWGIDFSAAVMDMAPPLYSWICACGARKTAHAPGDIEC